MHGSHSLMLQSLMTMNSTDKSQKTNNCKNKTNKINHTNENENATNDRKKMNHKNHSNNTKNHTKPKNTRKRNDTINNKDAKVVHAPILAFPYSWLHLKDTPTYTNHTQFHKKSKPLSHRITLPHSMDHLLSPSKCSKRYLSAYCLNLHQLTNSKKLLEGIIKKCTPVIKQLYHLTKDNAHNNNNSKNNNNKNNKQRISKPPTHSASVSIDFDINAMATNKSLSVTPALTPVNLHVINDDPFNSNDDGDTSPLQLHSPLQSLDQCIEEQQTSIHERPQQMAHSNPPSFTTQSNGILNAVPLSKLDKVETRSCPDLDEYTNISDKDDQTNPNHEKNGQNAQNGQNGQTTKNNHDLKKEMYDTRMKAYCIATVKHNIDILYHWIYYYPSDFADSPILDRLMSLIAKVKDRVSLKSIIRRWQKLLQLIAHRKPKMKHSSVLSSSISNLRVNPKVRTYERKTSFQFTDSFFPPRQMVAALGGSVDLLKIHPALVADQLTLIDTEIYLQIGLREFTNQFWQKNKADLSDLSCGGSNNDEMNYQKLQKSHIFAPNLLYMIDHVNRLSLWVATEILMRNTTAEMADMAKYFYVVAHRCLQLSNIHTCTAIFGGICLHSIQRLRRLSRYLADDQQIQTLHSMLNEMVSSNDNYKTYRTYLEQCFDDSNLELCNKPMIPFIPVVIKDLYNIQMNLTSRMDVVVDDGGGGGVEGDQKKSDKSDKCDNKCNEGKKEVNVMKKEVKCLDLSLLEMNCRHIRRIYESQQRAKLYANKICAETDVQSKLRMNIAKFENADILREWSFEIQPKLTKEDKENLEMIDTLEEFGFL